MTEAQLIEQVVAGSGRVVVVGHRGAAALAPENTIVSFEMAAALGASAFECDVHLTRDGEVVVIHDATVDRTSNGHGAVADMTLSELRRLGFGVRFPRLGPQTLPTLTEALQTARRLGMDIIVEIKGTPEPSRRLVERVVSDVVAQGMVERCALISFYHPCLSWVREECESISTGILFEHDIPDPVAAALRFGANSVRPAWGRASRRLAEAAHAAGLCLHAWTVNDAALTQRLADVGVDSICSDTPAVVRQALLEIGRLAGVDTTLGRSATENGSPACDVRRPETAAKTPEPGAERPSR